MVGGGSLEGAEWSRRRCGGPRRKKMPSTHPGTASVTRLGCQATPSTLSRLAAVNSASPASPAFFFTCRSQAGKVKLETGKGVGIITSKLGKEGDGDRAVK